MLYLSSLYRDAAPPPSSTTHVTLSDNPRRRNIGGASKCIEILRWDPRIQYKGFYRLTCFSARPPRSLSRYPFRRRWQYAPFSWAWTPTRVFVPTRTWSIYNGTASTGHTIPYIMRPTMHLCKRERYAERIAYSCIILHTASRNQRDRFSISSSSYLFLVFLFSWKYLIENSLVYLSISLSIYKYLLNLNFIWLKY